MSDDSSPRLESDQPIPDFYVDQTQVTTSVFGISLMLGLTDQPETTLEDVAQPKVVIPKVRIRMSLEHAKVVAMLMRRQLKAYERQLEAEIPLPADLYNVLELPYEDW